MVNAGRPITNWGITNHQEMSTLLVLGGTSEIAVAIAIKFASKGYNIQLAARHIDRLIFIQSDIMIRFGVECTIHEFDALEFEQHPSFFESLEQKPDIVICAFGYLGDQILSETSWAENQLIININYTGAVSILNIFANFFSNSQKGTIIGMSSVAGERGKLSNYAYGSAKAGFTVYLSGLRNRMYNSHVNVISVLPGFVYTKMTKGIDLPKFLTVHPSVVADAVYKGFSNGANIVYVKWVWRWVMLGIRLLPESIFKRLKL